MSPRKKGRDEAAPESRVDGTAEPSAPSDPPQFFKERVDVFKSGAPVYCCTLCEHNTTELGVAYDHARRIHHMKPKEA